MAANTVNFYQPGTDAAVDQSQILRQRQLAQLMMQKGQETPQGQMVSGHYVAPGAASYLAQIANAAAGAYIGNNADDRDRQLAAALRASRVKEANEFTEALSGKPGQVVQPLTPNDDEGNPMPVAQTAAVAPDTNRAMQIGLQSQNPQLQALAAKLMEQKMQDAAFDSMVGGGAAPGPGGAAPAGGAPGAPAGGGQFLGEGYGQIPTGLARLMYRKDPAEFAKAVVEARKPQALREGDLVGPAPGGGIQSLYNQPKLSPNMQVTGRDANGQVTGAGAIPGTVNAVGALSGAAADAEQQAKAANTLQTIDIPGIGPVTKTIAQWQAAGAGGSRAPAQPAPGAPNAVGNGTGPVNGQRVPNPMAPRPGDDDRVAIYTQERASAAKRLADAQATKDPAQIARAQADVDALEKEIRSNRIQIPTAPGGGIVGQDKSAQEYDTTRAKAFAESAAAIQKAGQSAAGMLRNYDTLEQLYKDPNVASGAAAENISGLKNLGASFGIDTKGVGAEQAIQSITNKMALDQRSTADGGGMPGALSDSDRNFLKAQTPGLEKTPEGRALIIANGRALAQRQLQAARMATDYELQHGRLDIGFDRQLQEFANANPLFANAKPVTAAPAAVPDMKALATRELERRKRASGGS